jgi:signal transduction histidine kinase
MPDTGTHPLPLTVAGTRAREAAKLWHEIEDAERPDRAVRSRTRLPWRQAVMQGMLTVVGVVAPLFSAVGLLVRSAPLTAGDVVVMTLAGTLPPLLRLARRPSIRARASVAITIGLGAGVYFLARIGFVAGVGVVLVATSVIGVICLGRRFAFALIAAAALAHAAIGALVGEGSLTLDIGYLDPLRAQNWIRAAAATTLVASLLALVVDFVIRQLEQASAAATGTLSQLRRVYVRLERTEEEQRRFLAHELHDELGQILTTLKARFTLTGEITNANVRPPGLESPTALIDQLIGRVRTLSSALRPPLLDEVGLVPAVRAFADAQAAATGLEVGLEATGRATRDRLPPDVEIACFRIIQESVTNAVRHARARRLQIAVDQDAQRVALAIRDDGRGFDAGVTLDAAAAAGHLGVVGMRERVRGRGGSFRLESQPGSGTVVAVEFPL